MSRRIPVVVLMASAVAFAVAIACDRRTPPPPPDGGDNASSVADASTDVVEKKKKPRFGPPRAEQIVAFGDHRCARMDDGTVRCWGSQVVDHIHPHSDEFFFTKPFVIPHLENATAVATGRNHTCAIVTKEESPEGSVTCWGGNGLNEAEGGPGDATTHLTQVKGMRFVKEIAAGDDHTCAIANNGTFCWGRSTLSISAEDKSASPVQQPALVDLHHITLGKDMSCARTIGGAASCWGRFPIPLPVGDTQSVVIANVTIEGVGNVRDIAIDGEKACAVNDEGALYCWTRELPLLRGRATIKPTRVVGPPPLGEIELSSQGACALLANGGVRCWELNAGSDVFPPKGPGTPIAGTDDALELAGTCIRTNEGKVLCWGSNERGQLGLGEQDDQFAPVAVKGPPEGSGTRQGFPSRLSDATSIALGNRHTCALLKDARVACWGDNEYGAVIPHLATLGNDLRNRFISVPTIVKGIDDVIEISAGHQTTCVLRRDRKVTCWGWGYYQEGGRPPIDRIAGLTDVAHIASAGDGSCALRSDGTVWCWIELHKKLAAPTALAGVEGIVELAMTRQFMIGRTAAGKVVVWGYPDIIDPKAPRDQAHTLSNVTQAATRIAAGGSWVDSACILMKSDPMRCFSDKPDLPDAAAKAQPHVVFTSIAIGDGFACGLTKDGVRCVGPSKSKSGSLGCPVAKDGFCAPAGLDAASVAMVGAGEGHACALMRDGTVRCWGRDWEGQLGIGRVLRTEEARPVTF